MTPLELWASGSLHRATINNCSEKRSAKLPRVSPSTSQSEKWLFLPVSHQFQDCYLFFSSFGICWSFQEIRSPGSWVIPFKISSEEWHIWQEVVCWNYFILYFSYSAVVPEAQDTALGLSCQHMFACVQRPMNPKRGTGPPFRGPGVTSAHSSWLTPHPACSPDFLSLQPCPAALSSVLSSPLVLVTCNSGL